LNLRPVSKDAPGTHTVGHEGTFMKFGRILATALFGTLLSGGCCCAPDYFDDGRPHTFFRYAFRNIFLSPIDAAHEHERVCRNQQLGWAAWREICKQEGKDAYPPDYASGFIAGYTDYLTFGGSGDPPPLPPHRYRTPQYETPSGRQAVEAWFEGFRRGTGAAQASGYREAILLPLGRAPLPPTVPGAAAWQLGERQRQPFESQQPEAPQELPMPRVAPDAPPR
jgi:hypothetical protein